MGELAGLIVAVAAGVALAVALDLRWDAQDTAIVAVAFLLGWLAREARR